MDVHAVWKRYTRSKASRSELSPNLDVWIHSYEKKLLSIAFSILNDEFLAQDCVQEAFIKAGLKEHQLRDHDRVFAWLSQIVVNECKSQFRTKWKKKVFMKENPFEQKHVDKYPSEEKTDLYHHVLQLPEKYKMVILLYYYNDLPVSDVASLLKTEESTCKVWLHRARTKLRARIGGVTK